MATVIRDGDGLDSTIVPSRGPATVSPFAISKTITDLSYEPDTMRVPLDEIAINGTNSVCMPFQRS